MGCHPVLLIDTLFTQHTRVRRSSGIFPRRGQSPPSLGWVGTSIAHRPSQHKATTPLLYPRAPFEQSRGPDSRLHASMGLYGMAGWQGAWSHGYHTGAAVT